MGNKVLSNIHCSELLEMIMRFVLGCKILTAILLLCISIGYAQLRYTIPPLNSDIQFDGIYNEQAWAQIKPLPIIMHTPNMGNPPNERTEVFVAYENTYLYAAGRLYDREPDGIRASSKKRDVMNGNSGWFGIILDTFNDKENALAFFLHL